MLISLLFFSFSTVGILVKAQESQTSENHLYRRNILCPKSIIDERYTVHSCAGKGGEGEVYFVTDSQDQKEKVIKIFLSKEFKKRGLGDIEHFKVLQRIPKDSHLVTPLRLFQHQGNYVAVYEKMDGDLLQRHREFLHYYSFDEKLPFRWNIEELKMLTRNILSAIRTLHTSGFVHGDIKDINILRRGMIYYLGDLGHMRTPMSGANPIRNPFKGTVCYWPPEYFKSPDFRYSFDMWSFGMTLLMLFSRFRCPSKKKSENYLKDVYNFILELLKENEQGRPTFLRILDEYDQIYDEQELIKFNQFKDLVSRMLVESFHKRIKVDNALDHPFLKI